MKDFKNKVAVITGATSGIGRGIARKCCQEGMKVVLADIDAERLSDIEKELKESGGTVISVLLDVSKAEEVKNLAQKTLDVFGEVHLLFNNAGVMITNHIWENTLEDWNWMMGVNLWGVIHGIRTFIPIMLQQDTECHIVNTSSLAGLTPGKGIYGITKHAVVALTESLVGELAVMNNKIKVSVLCPSFVNTNILEAKRHRPLELLNDPANVKNHPELENRELVKVALESGTSPEEVAEMVFHGIINKKLYILTAMDLRLVVKRRMRKIMKEFENFKQISEQFKSS